MGGYCFLLAVRTLGTSLWTIKSNFELFVLSVTVSWISLFDGLLFNFFFSNALNIMFVWWWSWMWQESVWEEKSWANPPPPCVQAWTSPGWTGTVLGRIDISDRKVQTQQPSTTWVLGVFGVTSVRNDLFSPSCSAKASSSVLCLDSFTLCSEFLWDLFPTLFSFFSTVLLRGIVSKVCAF